MARYAFRKIVVIFVLCVAVLLISGIALPKLISNQYLKLRSELNAYSQSLKRDPNATMVGHSINVSKNDGIHSDTNTSALESLQLRDLSPETIPFASKKVKKRSKRRASYKNGNEQFAWNFNINVTRYENNTPQMPIENNKAKMSSDKNKNYLGMAVYVEGNGPKQNDNQLENAWNSVGNLIRSLFGESVESVSPQIKQTNESGKVVLSFSGSLQTESDLDATENLNLRNFDEGSGDEPLNVSGRDSRWLRFGFLRFGGQSLDKTTSFPKKSLGSVTDTTDPSILSKESERDENIFKDFPTSTDLQKFGLSTEMSDTNFQSNSSNKPRSPVTEPVFIENARENASENADEDFGIVPFEQKNSTVEDYGCLGCEHSSIEVPVMEDNVSEVPVMEDNASEDISQTNAFLFTDEEFEKYCMILKQQLESQEHPSLTVGNSDSESSIKNPEHESHQLLDIFNLMKSFEESKLKTDGDIIENSSVGNDTSTSPRTNPAMNKEGRFFNWNMLGFGSGRSAIEAADFTFDEPNLETTKEFKNLPSILDCENDLRSKQNIITSSKPNLDAIDSNVKLTDLSDSTILPQFKEQKLQLPDTIKTSLNNSYVKYHDTDSENVIKSTITDEENIVSPGGNLISLSLKNKWSTEENSVALNQATVPDLNNQLVTEGNTENQHATESQSDGRFFSIFGFGSGSSPEVASSGNDERFFLGSFLGSGEGRLRESSDSITGSDTSLLRSEDSFQEIDFLSSADPRILDSFSTTGKLEDKATTVQERRFWGLLGFAGSGDGRLSNVNTDNETEIAPLIENGCENDCFQDSNNTDYTYDCSDDRCDLENSHNHTMVTEFPNEYPITKINCEGDCFHESNNTDSSYDCNDDQCDFENPHNHTMVTEFPNEYPITNESDCMDDCFYGSNKTDSNYDCNGDQCDFETSHNHTKVSEFPNEYPITEINCEDDCFQESNNTDSSYDCNGDQCDFENSHNHTMVTKFPNEHPITNESDCMDGCSYGSNNTDSNYDCNGDQCDFETSHNHTKVSEFPNEYPITEINCEDDCFQESNNTDSSYDCNGDQCDFENPHNHTMVTEFPNEYPITKENDCEGDCFYESNNTDSNYDCNDDQCDFETSYNHTKVSEFPNDPDCQVNCFHATSEISHESITESILIGIYDENLTTVNMNNIENCNDCSHETYEVSSTSHTLSKENNSFFECDDCDSNVYEMQNKSHADTEKKFSMQPESKSGNVNNSYQSLENDCNDCIYENDSFYNEQKKSQIDDASEILPNYTEDLGLFEISEYGNSLKDKASTFHADAMDIGGYTEVNNEVGTGLTDILVKKEQTTEKSRRFLGTIFLTGSGDGGLLEDSGGPINLIEEDSTIKQPVRFSRKGRLDDTLEVGNQSSLNPELEPISLNEERSTIKSPTQFPGRRGRLDDTIPVDDQGHKKVQIQDDTSSNITDINLNMDDSTLTYFSSKERANGEMTVAVNLTHSPDTFPKRILDFPRDVYKITDQPRFCIGANQCSAELNERCIMQGTSSVCDCNRHFIRNKETGKCVVKNTIEASLMFPAEKFDEDLTNPNSSRYKQKRKDSIDTMWTLLSENPEILRIVAEVDVTEFRAGSLIVSWYLIIAAENETKPNLANYVQSDLNKALENNILRQKVSLDIRNASVIAISNNLDPCSAPELNYCSNNAQCTRNGAFPGGFVCSCEEEYLDASISKDYPGEVCEAFCPPFYCGTDGHCELKDGGKRCLCGGWQFGSRCEISGIVVVATFSANIVLIVVVVILVVLCKGRCRKRHYGGTQRFQPYEATGTSTRSGRLADVIALEENTGARVAKFVTISTPMQDLPVIKVTRPTLNESSISFDYDSTFDVTPSISQIQNSIDQEVPSTV